ncbi:MAG: non-homologous end-joining DNA ligase [Saprospiraceae bacterium]|nr:non-homologous end-joining DNA ligase [Saprospiraceae bacterium]
MAKFQLTQVGKHKIKLTNLDKVLFPESGIIKAELVNYYLQMSSTMQRYIKNRPLSLIRYPDGIDQHQFFQKDKPQWAPKWIDTVALGKTKKKEYMLANNDAVMVFLANLASVEFHVTQDKAPNNDIPNFFIFDLDPEPGQSFEQIKDIAYRLREFVDALGYRSFVKTSGGKGIHLFIPIEPVYDYDTMFAAVESIGKDFVLANPKECTLKIKKEARKGKMLIDIYRNRASQTIIAPYSVRGRKGGPVSMPMSWERLESVTSPNQFHLRNVYQIVKDEGDAWEGFASYASFLHTDTSNRTAVEVVLPESEHYKTPAQLEAYAKKRDFGKTPEPAPSVLTTDGNAFVVHRHHASSLHYDLRLEKDGTLLSWAVPKGLPHKPGIKRLAVETEPHPIQYLQFDGEIPKGEYGGGMMWIYARGKYEITKEKKNGFYFRLSSPQLEGEYRMHNTKPKEWLLERVDRDLIRILDDPMAPMLADQVKTIPRDADDYFYEVKWDGIRAIISVEEGQVIIRSRNQNDLTAQFPELCNVPASFRIANAIFDGEIVCLDAEGRPDFKRVIGRMHSKNPGRIQTASRSNPAVCYLFDCLYLDGRSLLSEPIERRRAWLKDSIKKDSSYRMSEDMADGQALYEAARGMQLEGIMAKRRGSKYAAGKRSRDWLKIKFRQTDEVYIIGFTEGQGDRIDTFGALHLAEISGPHLYYRGKVGTGFDGAKMKEIRAMLDQVERSKKPFADKTPDDAVSTWIEPTISCIIEYASLTKNGTYREPVFQSIRSI